MKKQLRFAFVQLFLLALPVVVWAQVFPPSSTGPLTPPSSSGGVTPVTITNPLGDIKDFPTLIKKLFEAILPIGVSIAVLFIVWAGFKFVWAQGKPEELKQARNNFLYTIIGIGIFLAAWSISIVVSNTIRGLQGSNAPVQENRF